MDMYGWDRTVRKTVVSGLTQAESFLFSFLRVFLYILQNVLNTRNAGWLGYLKSIKSNTTAVDCSKITEDALNLPKIPKHIGFIIDDEENDLESIVNMIVWSFLLGVSNVTIADQRGRLEDDLTTIEQSFKKKCQNPEYKQCPECVFHSGMSKAENMGTCNVIITSPKTSKRFFMTHVENTCRQMKGSVSLQRTMNPDKFSEILEEAKGSLPDPCLLVVFGNLFTFHGFNPWSLRLTEFTNLPSHCNLSYDTLLTSFRKFAKCKQRWGI